jgi:pSer/pThr/pTyr-binding forkhead associated (FHA) protein
MPRLEVILPVPGLDDPRLTRIMPYTLTEARYMLGSSVDNDILIRGQCVSRYHAYLERTDDGKYQIVDGSTEGVKSSNGVLVNGRKYTKKVLEQGDEVVLGQTVIKIVG